MPYGSMIAKMLAVANEFKIGHVLMLQAVANRFKIGQVLMLQVVASRSRKDALGCSRWSP